MAKKSKPLTTEQRLDLLKGVGRGIVEIMKQPIPAYVLTSLGILGLGKARILPCHAVGALQGVHTYLAISHEVTEGDSSFFGVDGIGETIAKGGTSTLIGLTWAKLAKQDCDLEFPGEPDVIKQHAKCWKQAGAKKDFWTGEWISGEAAYRECMGWPPLKTQGQQGAEAGEAIKSGSSSTPLTDFFGITDPAFEVHKKPKGWP